MAKLSSLIVDLQADTASLKSGLDDAKKMIGDLNKKVDAATKTIGALFVLDKMKDAIVGLASFVHSGAEAADQAGKMAQAAGTTVEAFTQLDYAASLSDISTEELGASIAKLNKKMGEAAQGGKQQQAVFKALGVSVTDSSGRMRSADVVIGDLADRFAGMEDGAAKAALAQEIFGKSGARLIPLLNQGKAGLREMAEEADRFGFTVSGAGARSAEIFNDSITRLQNLGKGLSRAISENLTPSLSALSEELLTSAGNSKSLKMAAEGIAVVFRTLVSAGIVVVGTLQHVGITIAGLAAAGANLVKGNFAGAKEAMRASAEELRANLDVVDARLKAAWKTTQETTDGEQKAHKASADAVVASIGKKKKALEDYERATEKLSKMTNDLLFQVVTFGKGDEEILQQRMLFGDLTEEIKKAGKAGERFAEQMLQAAKALRELKLEQKAKEIGTSESRKFHVGAPPKVEELAAEKGFAVNAPQSVTFRDPRVLKAQAEMLKSGVDFQRKVQDALSAMGNGIVRGLQLATGGLLQAMGGIGNIISSFVDNVANEGLWEAVIAAIGQIIAAAPAFGQVIDMAAGILQVVAGALNNLINGLQSLLAGLGWAIEVIIDALSPVFDAIGQLLSDLAPFLWFIVVTVKTTLGPIMKALGAAFKALSPVLKILFDVIRFIVIGSFYVIKGLAAVWNGILSAIQSVFRTLGNIDIFGAKPFKFLLDWADGLEKAKATTVGLDNAIEELKNTTFEDVKAQQEAKGEEYKAIAAQEKATKSMNDVSKAASGLTNVPALLKVNRLRGLAADAAGAPEFNLYIDGQQVFTTVSRRAKNSRFNQDGSRMGGL